MKIIIKDKKVYRKVNNIESFRKLISVFEAQNLLGSEIVDTKIIDIEKNLLEHPFINPIIHSGEFTISMAYDIMNNAFNVIIVEDARLELKGTEEIFRTDIPEADIIGVAGIEPATWRLCLLLWFSPPSLFVVWTIPLPYQ